MSIEKVVNIKVNSKQAAKSLDDLNKIIEEQKNIQLELQRELLNTEKLLKETPKDAIAAQTQLKKKIEDIKAALKDQNLSLKELNSEKQKAIAKDKEQEKSTGKLSKSFKGLNSTLTSLGVIGLIVTLVAKLTETFRENQKVVDFVSSTFTAVSIITNELINKFTDIFSKISEATGGFDALGAVVGGVVKIAFNQLKLTVLTLQGGFTSLKLAYEKFLETMKE
jgi:chromosome segregation ATPase